MNLSRLATKFDTGGVKDDGTFTGYASVFGNVDSYRDVVAKGAFKTSLEHRPASRVKLLWQHDASTPIGVWKAMSEDSTGLVAEGQLALNTTKGREAYELMKMGAVDGLSIGFITKTDEFDRQTGIRTIKAADLLEVSVVTFPANSEALVSGVKADDMTERDFERFLRDAGFSATQAKTIVSSGFKTLKRERDAALEASTTELSRALGDLAARIARI